MTTVTGMSPDRNAPRLVLASGSPRRSLLLSIAGYEFTVVSPDIEEAVGSAEPAEEFVVRMAREKAAAVANGQSAGTSVLAFDTCVVLDGQILGKPRDEGEAVEMLLSLAGRTHVVVTGYCLNQKGNDGGERNTGDSDTEEWGVDAARVTLRPVARTEAEAYAATGEPMDKAGAYALQGKGRGFVTKVEGLRSTVIGLPLEHVVDLLTRRGIMPTREEPDAV